MWKLKIKAGVFIPNFEHILHLVLVFLLLEFGRINYHKLTLEIIVRSLKLKTFLLECERNKTSKILATENKRKMVDTESWIW